MAARVKGVTCETDVWVFAATQSPEAMLEVLDAQQVKGRSLLWDEAGRTMAVVPLQDVHAPEILKTKLPKSVTVLEDHGTVTCVGTGLNADWSVSRKALAVAKALGAQPAAAYASALQLTLVVKRDQVKALTKALHEALIG